VRSGYLRGYLVVLGAALLFQGASSLLLHEVLDVDLSGWHGLLTTDDRHATVHVVWGVLTLLAAAIAVEPALVGFGFVFGAFYVALAVLGVVVHDPFGLRLGFGENAFHWIIGPLALVLALTRSRDLGRKDGIVLPSPE
jgi:hypothetical protein